MSLAPLVASSLVNFEYHTAVKREVCILFTELRKEYRPVVAGTVRILRFIRGRTKSIRALDAVGCNDRGLGSFLISNINIHATCARLISLLEVFLL